MPAASDRIILGFIGLGEKAFAGCAGSLIKSFIDDPSCRIRAVCDINRLHREEVVAFIDSRYGDKSCDAYNDFRELIARNDIDAVVIATPEHWHAVQTIWACRHGKDVYCEKPMALTIREARAMAVTARQYGRVVQYGVQGRASSRLRFACEAIRSGRIGDIVEVEVNCWGPSGFESLPAEPVPEYIDWDLFVGPAPWRPYNHVYTPQVRGWMAYSDFGGGGMTDMGAHNFDLAQRALGMDNTGPVEIIPPDGKQQKKLQFRYANGVKMVHNLGGDGENDGVLFIGKRGKARLHPLSGNVEFYPEDIGRVSIRPDEVHLCETDNPYTGFLECIRSRQKPCADVEIGCRSVTLCHLGNLAYWLRRPLKWNPDKEEFVDDDEANLWLDRPKREPWTL